jgi:hypothetical protein
MNAGRHQLDQRGQWINLAIICDIGRHPSGMKYSGQCQKSFGQIQRRPLAVRRRQVTPLRTHHCANFPLGI